MIMDAALSATIGVCGQGWILYDPACNAQKYSQTHAATLIRPLLLRHWLCEMLCRP